MNNHICYFLNDYVSMYTECVASAFLPVDPIMQALSFSEMQRWFSGLSEMRKDQRQNQTTPIVPGTQNAHGQPLSSLISQRMLRRGNPTTIPMGVPIFVLKKKVPSMRMICIGNRLQYYGSFQVNYSRLVKRNLHKRVLLKSNVQVSVPNYSV